MVDLRCQDTDWVDGNDREVLDAIFGVDGLILLKLRFANFQSLAKKGRRLQRKLRKH